MTMPNVAIAITAPTDSMHMDLQECIPLARHCAQASIERAVVPHFGLIDYTLDQVMLVTGNPGETIVMRVHTNVPGLAEAITQQLRPIATVLLFPENAGHILSTMASETLRRALLLAIG